MQTYSQTLAAGSTLPIHATIKFFRIISAPDPVTVRFWRHGAQISIAEAVGVGFWSKPRTAFDRVEIYSATAQTLSVVVGDGDGGYDRMSVYGQVEVVDGEYTKVMRDEVFGVAKAFPAPGVGLYNQCALIPGAGKRALIREIIISCAAAASVVIGENNVSFLAGYTTTVQAPTFGVSAVRSIADTLLKHPPVMPGGITSPLAFFAVALGAGIPLHIPFRQPIVVTDTMGLNFICMTTNMQMSVSCVFEEKSAV